MIELFSKRAHALKASEIRELLKLVQSPDMISFAGGLPNPKTFPGEELKEIVPDVISRHGRSALQYGVTEGIPQLRDGIVEWMKRENVELTRENILITSGSQQGLDLVGRIFIDPEDPVILGAPSYLGAISAFGTLEPNLISIPLDDDGLQVEILEDKLPRMRNRGSIPKMVYTVPTFQNPAGVTMSLKRRKKLIDLSYEFDFAIIEDNPYSELRYTGDPIPTLISLDQERVVYLGTFSKIFAPGLRMAWLAGPHQIINKLTLAKQATDLCSPAFNQFILYEFMERGHLQPHITEIKELYSGKRKVMLDEMKEQMPEGMEWTKPEGGMFLWATVPCHIDTQEMFPKALEKKVAYVAGTAFHADGGGQNSMRINFSYSSDDEIKEGVDRLSTVVREEMSRVSC